MCTTYIPLPQVRTTPSVVSAIQCSFPTSTTLILLPPYGRGTPMLYIFPSVVQGRIYILMVNQSEKANLIYWRKKTCTKSIWKNIFLHYIYLKNVIVSYRENPCLENQKCLMQTVVQTYNGQHIRKQLTLDYRNLNKQHFLFILAINSLFIFA